MFVLLGNWREGRDSRRASPTKGTSVKRVSASVVRRISSILPFSASKSAKTLVFLPAATLETNSSRRRNRPTFSKPKPCFILERFCPLASSRRCSGPRTFSPDMVPAESHEERRTRQFRQASSPAKEKSAWQGSNQRAVGCLRGRKIVLVLF